MPNALGLRKGAPMSEQPRPCDCEFCRDEHDFTVGDEFMDEMLSGRVVVFAGAGVSTESRRVLRWTLYDEVAAQLKLREANLSFPDLMARFEGQPNGRMKLLKTISDRISYVDSFPELERIATAFHRELGTLFPVQDIVTTNWDPYFERHCGATPFVVDADLAFWEAADRRVLKIHGSIGNWGSIVATTSDYDLCHDRLTTGIVGSLLKSVLATRTVLFVGYSFSDPDFAAIYDLVCEQMKSLKRQAYVVTPFEEECSRFRDSGFVAVCTDGSHFIREIKAHAVSRGLLLEDSLFDAAADLLEDVQDEHDRLSHDVKIDEFPLAIYAGSYQDGMLHALERALNLRGTGQYSDPRRVHRVLRSYEEWQKKKRHAGAYEDVAYIDGYINVLVYLLMTDDERHGVEIPLYLIFGVDKDIFALEGFVELATRYPNAHKAALARARKYVKRLQEPERIIYHHPPWL